MTKEKTICPKCNAKGWLNYDTSNVNVVKKTYKCEKCGEHFEK